MIALKNYSLSLLHQLVSSNITLFFSFSSRFPSQPFICLVVWCVPCGANLVFGQISETMGEQECALACTLYYLASACGCCCLVHFPLRARIREKYGIPESDLTDIVETAFCVPCTLVQEYDQVMATPLAANMN